MEDTPEAADIEEKKRRKKELAEQKRAQKFEYIKMKTKERTRESIKRKRRAFAQRRDKECEGMTEEERKEWMEKQKEESLQKKARLVEAMTTGQRVAIDIHYQDQMNTKEQFSVVRQLGLCHKANKEAKEPVSIHVCGATPETTPPIKATGGDKWPMTFHKEDLKDVFSPDEMIYFSPDAPDPISTIDPSKVYVIGGLVDRSIAKNQSYDRAKELGVPSVRLPLAEFYPECQHRVMNINTIVEMIIAFKETNDWKATFERCIPLRKKKVEDETGHSFDYHSIHSVKELESISEYRINRFQLKHALHIYCQKHQLEYEFENREIPYEEYEQEVKEQEDKPPYFRFLAKVKVNGKLMGEGKGKSQRSAQGKASWYALVELGDIEKNA